MMIENRQLLVLTHLSQLLDLVTGVGGFIVPLVIWLTNKDDVIDMDLHGTVSYTHLTLPTILLV